jgi:hypothetical protein
MAHPPTVLVTKDVFNTSPTATTATKKSGVNAQQQQQHQSKIVRRDKHGRKKSTTTKEVRPGLAGLDNAYDDNDEDVKNVRQPFAQQANKKSAPPQPMEMRCRDSSWAPADADAHQDEGGPESAAESLRDSPILCLEVHAAATGDRDLLPTILGRLQQLLQLPLEVRHFHPVQLPRLKDMYVF